MLRAEDIVAIRLPTFVLPEEEIRSALWRLAAVLKQRVSSLIIDLSGNTGGNLGALYELLSALLPVQSPASICRSLSVRAVAEWNNIYQRLQSAWHAFPPKVGVRPAAGLLELLVSYTITADLPFAARKEAVHCRTKLFNATLTDQDRSSLLHGTFKKILGSQPQRFLFGSLLEPQAVLLRDGVHSMAGGEIFTNNLSFACTKKILPKVCVDYVDQEKQAERIRNLASMSDRIVVLSDGQCASACSQFVSALRTSLKEKVKVVTYGGLYGEAISPSRAAGGSVYVSHCLYV